MRAFASTLALASCLAYAPGSLAFAQDPPAPETSAPPPESSPAPAPASGQTPPAPPPSPPPPQAPDKSPEELAAIRERVANSNAQTAAILKELSALDAQIFHVNQTILDGERQAAEIHNKMQGHGEEVLRLELRFVELKGLWNKNARRIYKDTPGTTWAPLFMAQTWSDLGRLKRVWKDLAEGHTALVAESARLKEQLVAEKGDLVKAAETLSKRNRELSTARERLRKARQARTTSLGRLRLAIGQAMAAEQAALAADAVGMRIPHLCNPGSAVQDQRLADVLDWYAPAGGPDSFPHPKFSPTGVVLTAQASWYGPAFEGCRASSGATFRSNQMTAASLTLPFGTFLKVSNAGKSVVVVITDRGPYVAGRELDLSQAAAEAIGLPGVGQVTMEVVLPSEPSPPFP